MGITDPTEPGLSVYSDVVLFENAKGWFAAISVKSEEKLLQFCRNSAATGMANEVKNAEKFYYLKAKNRHIYFAFKHKAAVFYIPSDTTVSGSVAGETLAPIFSENPDNILKNEKVQELYNQDCQVVYYSSASEFGLSHGIQLQQPMAKFIYQGKKPGSVNPSPLMLFVRAGSTYGDAELEKTITKNNQIGSREYLNQTFKTVCQYLKPFQK